MSADDLTEHLRRLRVRAGNPSVRELERLTEQQGPRRRLSSSTIHDKLNGKSPLKLGQLLALVQACTDYAQGVGITLNEADVDEELWRKRLESVPALVALKPRGPLPVPTPAVALLEKPDLTSPERRIGPLPWDVEPLRRAGMDDLVELVENSADKPMAEWLPRVLYALATAGMSYGSFLDSASQHSVREVVALIGAMGDDKDDEVISQLLFRASKNQEAADVPSLVVALRRASQDYFDGHALAERLISFISGKDAGWFASSLRRDCAPVIRAFRSATMLNDAYRLVQEIGINRTDAVISVVEGFGGPDARDGTIILRAVARGTEYHLSAVLKELRVAIYPEDARRKYLTHIISGVPNGQHERIAELLDGQGLADEANLFRELKDAPPF